MTYYIVSDIDGTLTDKKRRITIDAINALREAEAEGFHVSLSTGNTLGYAHGASRLIGATGGMIAEDGGIVSYNTNIETFGTLEEPLRCYELIKDRASLLPTFLRKTEVVVTGMGVEEIQEVAERHDLKIEICDSSYGIHIKNKNVNKGTALKKLAELMEIDLEDTVFIGDSYNDLPAFEAAGYSIAVNSGVEELKEKADYVTKKPYGEGGAEAIRKIIQGEIP